MDSSAMLPISVPRGCPSLVHALYADDIFIFCRRDMKSLVSLNNFLEDYGQTSGQRINKHKSLLFLGKYATSREASIRSVLGFAEKSLPFNYFGVLIFKCCPKMNHLQVLATKLA